jgi:hypothetical protein
MVIRILCLKFGQFAVGYFQSVFIVHVYRTLQPPVKLRNTLLVIIIIIISAVPRG